MRVLVFLLATAATGLAACPTGWTAATNATGGCYIAFMDGTSTCLVAPASVATESFSEAELSCNGIGGYLAVIMSSADNLIVRNLLYNSYSMWIGFTSDASISGSYSTGYQWTAGNAASYTDWDPNQNPTTADTNEQCAYLGHQSYGSTDDDWYTAECCLSLPFVCWATESSAVAQPSWTSAYSCEPDISDVCEDWDVGGIVGLIFCCICCSCGIGAIGGGIFLCMRQRRPQAGLTHAQPGVIQAGQPVQPGGPGAMPVYAGGAPPGYQQPGAAVGGAGWQQVVDPSTGKTYEHNPATGETRWLNAAPQPAAQPVVAQPLPQPVPQPTGPSPGWERHTDPSTGKQYEYNASTNETRWLDDEPAAAAPAAVVPQAQPAAAAAAGPAAGWERHTDPSSGKQYEHNPATGETRWL